MQCGGLVEAPGTQFNANLWTEGSWQESGLKGATFLWTEGAPLDHFIGLDERPSSADPVLKAEGKGKCVPCTDIDVVPSTSTLPPTEDLSATSAVPLGLSQMVLL